MRIEFTLRQRIVGVCEKTAEGPGFVSVITSESLTSHDGAILTWRLEELQRCVFADIPDLPPPSMIDNLLVIIGPDLAAVAYVNELRPRALMKANRPISAGETVLVQDIADISSFDLGVEIPDDAAFILVRSFGWRKSLFYDLRPLDPSASRRAMDIPSTLARQALTMYQRPFLDMEAEAATAQKQSTTAQELTASEGLARLNKLLSEHCGDERQYQELFQAHPWIFGGYYNQLLRHSKFNDEHIPDFTATRHQDACHDIIELKHPFLPCFRQSGGFSSEFNDAWNQAERYLLFARNNADYLRREKMLRFENPRCLLIMGYRFTQEQLRAIRDKETLNMAISVLSYDQLAAMAHALVSFVSGESRP